MLSLLFSYEHAYEDIGSNANQNTKPISSLQIILKQETEQSLPKRK